ncbi:MAG TPA: MBL fold metallo-hydrolase [Silvibacterium sp.]|jgi:glyoxylase-like metal-dependent hydrolase (beta-lactamase superfamily II)|nr:MBL fold metallo-hydrolase [Silvibacterium sp.]
MITRRGFLKDSAMMAAGTLAMHRTSFAALQNQEAPAAAPPPSNIIQSMLAAGATTPIQTTKLTDTIFLLQGVGGNMVAQIGPDGKLLIDSSVATAARAIIHALEKLSARPLKFLVNTHWHFDHTNGNAALHDAGALIIAQENTRLRLSTRQKMKLFNLDLPASPTGALPQLTFADQEKLYCNNDELDMVHTPDAHTDSDIFLHFVNGNVIHTGDLWCNGFYPPIDDSSGGTINGMIRGVDQVLTIADDKTKIVPGHGPLGDKRALQKYRDMLSTVANRIEKLKIAGQSLEQVVAAKPTADLDAVWAHGMMSPDLFVTVIYNTL